MNDLDQAFQDLMANKAAEDPESYGHAPGVSVIGGGELFPGKPGEHSGTNTKQRPTTEAERKMRDDT